MSARTYHPEFDPAAGRWFLPSGEEAPTIAALLDRLEPGAAVADYYPAGSRAPLFAPDRLRGVLSGAPVITRRRPAVERRRTSWTPDRCLLLRVLVGRGATARQIAAEMGSTRAAVLHQCERLGLKLSSRGGYSVRFRGD